MPSFTSPLAIGITNKHWFVAVKALLMWHESQKEIDTATLNESLKSLETLSSGTPEPSWDSFRIKAARVLPAKASDLLSQAPKKQFIRMVEALLMKDNNEITLKSYYKSRDVIRDIAFKHQEVVQKLDNGKLTTVGYQFARFYVNLKKILDDLVTARRYVETIGNDSSLDSLEEGFPIEQQIFMIRVLRLFETPAFSSSNQNWFAESAKELAGLSKGIIRYIRVLHVKDQVEVDSSLLSEAESSANATIAYSIPEFAIDLDTYMGLFIQMHNSFSGVIKAIRALRIHDDKIEVGISDTDKKRIRAIAVIAFKHIFDGERKREVFDEIFFEASEVENMIYRLSQEINNEYRDSTQPVCCVGFTEGAIILLGKILPLLNFPLYLVTDKLSFYGATTSGDTSKDIEINFDNSKFDGKRVLVFDDIIDQGITIRKFLEQARAKTKALDFKVCFLFAKPNPKNVYGNVDFLGSMLPNVWVVGYGFDNLFKHRNADAVGSIKESFKKE